MVTMLYVFDIRKPIGPDGRTVEPDLVLEDSSTIRCTFSLSDKRFVSLASLSSSYPKPFVCDFIPRSPQHVELLNATYDSVLPSVNTKPPPNKA